MTIMEAISRLDALKSNTYSHEEKVEWLSTVDGMVKRLIIDSYVGGEDVAFDGYDKQTDIGTQLLVSAPFDELYLRWMEAQIDYHNGDYDMYNNAIILFNAAFDTYRNFYIRTHTPLAGGGRFLF